MTRHYNLIALIALLAGAAGCLTWYPEPELDDDDVTDEPDDDDATAPDDDDVTPPDDDDATPPDDDDATEPDDDDVTPIDNPLEANSIGYLLVMDENGQEASNLLAAAMFTSELLAPSIEEALFEELFGFSYPAFGSPGGRLILPGDNYPVTPVGEVGDITFDFGSLGHELTWGGVGYGPLSAVVPSGFSPGDSWLLEVNGVPGYEGEFGAPGLPAWSDATFSRQIGDAVFLPEGETIELFSTPAGPTTVDHLIVTAGGGGGASIGFPIEADGSATVEVGDLPSAMVSAGEATLVVYRALRSLVITEEAGSLLLVTARWKPLEIHFLAPGVAFASATTPGPSNYGESVVVTVLAEGSPFLTGGNYDVTINWDTAGTTVVVSPNELAVTLPDGVPATGTFGLSVTDASGGLVAQGGAELELAPSPCNLTENEPNNTNAESQFILVDTVACGTLDPGGDVDTFRFIAQEDKTYSFETLADRLGWPTDTTLSLRTASGAEVLFNDDSSYLDSMITWTADDAGPMFIQVGHFGGGGSPAADYQLLFSEL